MWRKLRTELMGLRAKSLIMAVGLVAASIYLMLALMTDITTGVVENHERTDLHEETMMRGWEVLDRVDLLRQDVDRLKQALDAIQTREQKREDETLEEWVNRPPSPEFLNDRREKTRKLVEGFGKDDHPEAPQYLELITWDVENLNDEGWNLVEGSGIVATGLATSLADSGFIKDYIEQRLRDPKVQIDVSEPFPCRYELKNPRNNWSRAYHAVAASVWVGTNPGSSSAGLKRRTARLIVAVMSLDDAFLKIVSSPRHLGFFWDARGFQLPVHERGRATEATNDIRATADEHGYLPVPMGMELNRPLTVKVVPPWQSPRLALMTTAQPLNRFQVPANNSFYFTQTADLVSDDQLRRLLDSADAEIDGASIDQAGPYLRVIDAFDKLSKRYVQESWEADADQHTNYKRVAPINLQTRSIRMLAGSREALQTILNDVEKLLIDLEKEIGQPDFIDDKQLSKTLAASMARAIECRTAELSLVGLKLESPHASSRDVGDVRSDSLPDLVIGRAAFTEEFSADLKSELSNLWWPAIGWFIAAAVIAVGLTWFIVRPLRNMTAVAGQLSELQIDPANVDDNWKHEVEQIMADLDTERKDEIGRLARAFKKMVRGIADNHNALVELNRDLDDKVELRTSELRLANDDLQQAFDQLRQAQHQQKQFIFSISHDLKTPLTSIKGFAEVLMASPVTDEQREDLEILHGQTLRLQRLIQDILDFQKLGLGELELDLLSFDVGKLVLETAKALEPMAQKGSNLLKVVCPNDLPGMTSDPHRIKQVLENLLSNACKFTSNGEVRIEARREERDSGDWLIVHVADTGKGIPPEKQDLIFKPFPKILTKAENPTGTGLGLANCQGYCRALGGDIRFASKQGVGTTFTFELPMQVVSKRLKTELSRPAPLPQMNRASNTPVLVIDDEVEVCKLMERFLQRQGFSVITAFSAEQGIKLARQHHPMFITLDAIMPDRDGWSVLQELKSDTATAQIPVIVVSVLDEKYKGFALGASDYVNKPIDWELLAQKLERYRRSLRKPSVLVVEDDQTLRDLAARQLGSHGWEVLKAADGLEGLEVLKQHRPAVVLLDLLMPVMDGFEFLEKLRNMPDRADTAVIVLTGKNLTSEEREQLNGRVVQIMNKGSDAWEALEREIARLFSRQSDMEPAEGKA